MNGLFLPCSIKGPSCYDLSDIFVCNKIKLKSLKEPDEIVKSGSNVSCLNYPGLSVRLAIENFQECVLILSFIRYSMKYP